MMKRLLELPAKLIRLYIMSRPKPSLGQGGLQEIKMALIGTPTHQLVDLITEGVHWAGEATPSPSVTLTPAPSKHLAPASVVLSSERAYHFTTNMAPVSQKE